VKYTSDEYKVPPAPPIGTGGTLYVLYAFYFSILTYIVHYMLILLTMNEIVI